MPTEKENEMKECPFCGGRPYLAILAEDGEVRFSDKFAVRCEYTGSDKGCGAEGPHNKIKEIAIDEWNRRATIKESLPTEKLFCAMCGSWGDHTSGGCPNLDRSAPAYQKKAMTWEDELQHTIDNQKVAIARLKDEIERLRGN